MMRFIEKQPHCGNPLILRLIEDRQYPDPFGYNHHAMNFSLLTENNEDVAAGRCSIHSESSGSEFMYISAIYVDGNSNNPTKEKANRYVGLGQILMFSAIKFGYKLNITNVILTPLPGSQGFYLKMGLYPKVTGNPNRMVAVDDSLISNNRKLNPKWIHNFAQSSFLNKSFRGPKWTGNIPLIYGRLRENILRSWTIIE
jgi:hypothetical protein